MDKNQLAFMGNMNRLRSCNHGPDSSHIATADLRTGIARSAVCSSNVYQSDATLCKSAFSSLCFNMARMTIGIGGIHHRRRHNCIFRRRHPGGAWQPQARCLVHGSWSGFGDGIRRGAALEARCCRRWHVAGRRWDSSPCIVQPL